MPTTRPDFSRYKSLLLVRTDRIGDLLVTTPCIRALRETLPQARLDLVVSPLNAPAIRGNPHLDAVHVFDLRRPWTWPGLLGRLRAARYDAVLAFSSNSRSACQLIRLLGVPDRIGFNGLPTHKGKIRASYANTYTWMAEGGGQGHVILDMLDRLETLGVPAPSPHLDFVVPDDVTRAMRQRFPAVPGRLRLAIFVGNIKKIQNRWPIEKFKELALRLVAEEPDLDVVVLAGPSDRPLLKAFDDVRHPRLDYFVGSSLQETGGFLTTCCAMVAGSSGPTHVAAALDVPVLAVVTHHNATIWRTLGPHDVSVTPETDIRDMRGIPVEPVEAMVRRFLAEERARRAALQA